MLRSATRKISAIYDEALSPLDINVAQFRLLRAIERLQPVSLTDLAIDAQLDRSTIGRNVRVIERMDLVKMRRGEVDHREATVMLSPIGVELLKSAGPLWDDCQQAIETRLGPVKIIALQEILRSI
ncbi:MarR family winged helix-turn-helix transcriptional regulator [Agrobacterium fabrum]|uniref:MarR family winged helix-turn-helix transcriptional regulator n=1 Tax=Agrobacterium fabrum TaxID=1176649 RepID=UPI00215771C8|nr:MarR family winged helix-turn-helix transcriptional regulator [Agrobacterium fabrum]MCR6727657.1 MarR family winged helix-turn-helix transcriptional regulator [Agrobacterium fabrum]